MEDSKRRRRGEKGYCSSGGDGDEDGGDDGAGGEHLFKNVLGKALTLPLLLSEMVHEDMVTVAKSLMYRPPPPS